MTKSLVLAVVGAGILSAAPALADTQSTAVQHSIYETVRSEAAPVLQEGRSAASANAVETGFDRERAKRPVNNR